MYIATKYYSLYNTLSERMPDMYRDHLHLKKNQTTFIPESQISQSISPSNDLCQQRKLQRNHNPSLRTLVNV